MDKNTQELLKRVDYLIEQGNSVLRTVDDLRVDPSTLSGFRAASLSFISGLFGENHDYYTEFKINVKDTYQSRTKIGISILTAIKNELQQGWLTSIKSLITAEVFSDFLEMSQHLLDTGYKDPAAVMIGSVLEEHLRQLCLKNEIEITFQSGEDIKPKKAETLNQELAKKAIYNLLEQKSVTAWLDLRNKAAHGHYGEFVIGQVQEMYSGVLGFLQRNQL
ncbi:MAG TPA: hypothetical protein VK809_07870 [Bacteroidia bacterium]|jgi:hypothetical protein|nr:hypothetical protein [Bacteroidia bacterium]